MKVLLPRDIKRYILIKAVVYFVKLVLFETAMVLLNIGLWHRLVKIPIVHILVLMGTLVLPFLIISIPKEIFRSSIVGKVKAVHIKEETGTYKAGIRYFPYTKNVIFLDVETEKGRTVRVYAKEYGVRSQEGFAVPFEGNVQHHLNDYAVGDTVYRFRGLRFPLVVTKNPTNTTDCLVCGSESPCKESFCYYCGHTLLKIDVENE